MHRFVVCTLIDTLRMEISSPSFQNLEDPLLSRSIMRSSRHTLYPGVGSAKVHQPRWGRTGLAKVGRAVGLYLVTGGGQGEDPRGV